MEDKEKKYCPIEVSKGVLKTCTCGHHNTEKLLDKAKEDMWDAWWASAIKTISFAGIDKDYERRCFEKFYKNKLKS